MNLEADLKKAMGYSDDTSKRSRRTAKPASMDDPDFHEVGQ